MTEEASSNQSVVGHTNAQAQDRSNANVNSNSFEPTINISVGDKLLSSTDTKEIESCKTANKETHIWYVPFLSNPFFTGRDEILKGIYSFFNEKSTGMLSNILAISGLGGIGKTHTAIQYADLYKNIYQAVLWIRANQRETLMSDFIALAEMLKLPEKDIQEQYLQVNAVKRWLEAQANWLLILDNVEDLSLIDEFLPHTRHGHILLTTRLQGTGKNISNIELKTMTLEEGTLFLFRRIHSLNTSKMLQDIPQNEYDLIRNIVQLMDGLPLALEQAGAYIQETGCGLSGYLNLYQTQHKDLLNWHSDFESKQQSTVATTWSLSFKKIEAYPIAAELLNFCAFLHPDEIPREIIVAGTSFFRSMPTNQIQLDSAIKELKKYSLIQTTPAHGAISIHRLVQTILKYNMSLEIQHQWAEKIIKIIDNNFPEVDFKAWTQCQQYLPHAKVCADLIREWKITSFEATHLLNNLGQYLYERVNYEEAENLLQQAMAIHKQAPTTNNLDFAKSLNKIVTLYLLQGKYLSALPLAIQASNILNPQEYVHQIEVASSLNNLAKIYYYQGKYEQAEPLCKQALSIQRQVLGDEHPDIANSLNNLATLYMSQGKYKQAEPLYKQALSIQRQVLGDKHPEVAQLLKNYASLLKKTKRKKEAYLLEAQSESILNTYNRQ